MANNFNSIVYAGNAFSVLTTFFDTDSFINVFYTNKTIQNEILYNDKNKLIKCINKKFYNEDVDDEYIELGIFSNLRRFLNNYCTKETKATYDEEGQGFFKLNVLDIIKNSVIKNVVDAENSKRSECSAIIGILGHFDIHGIVRYNMINSKMLYGLDDSDSDDDEKDDIEINHNLYYETCRDNPMRIKREICEYSENHIFNTNDDYDNDHLKNTYHVLPRMEIIPYGDHVKLHFMTKDAYIEHLYNDKYDERAKKISFMCIIGEIKKISDEVVAPHCSNNGILEKIERAKMLMSLLHISNGDEMRNKQVFMDLMKKHLYDVDDSKSYTHIKKFLSSQKIEYMQFYDMFYILFNYELFLCDRIVTYKVIGDMYGFIKMTRKYFNIQLSIMHVHLIYRCIKLIYLFIDDRNLELNSCDDDKQNLLSLLTPMEKDYFKKKLAFGNIRDNSLFAFQKNDIFLRNFFNISPKYIRPRPNTTRR